MTVLSGKTQHKIRLYGIDTPEKAQPFGKAAKKFNSKLVAGVALTRCLSITNLKYQ